MRSSPPLPGACILLLEDDALISSDGTDMLLSLGVSRVLIARTLAEAQDILAREPVDAAVLDLVIGRERAEDFAVSLLGRPLPVVLASGFTDRAALPASLGAVPTVDKPYSAQALCRALTAAMHPNEPTEPAI